MIGRGGVRQEAGVRTTPHGPRVRYTIRFHVQGDRVGDSVRASFRTIDIPIVTPLGALTAAVVAARVLADREPLAFYEQVELAQREEDFVTNDDDIWDDAATNR